jgi:hypothetical protein
MERYLIAIMILIATATLAQAITPKHYSPGFSVYDEGFVEGLYDMSVWVVSESGFSNGDNTCTLLVSMDCQLTATFRDGAEHIIACDEEVPTGSTFIAACR